MTPQTLNLGLLLCDDVDAEAHAQYGTYAEMFRAGFHQVDPHLRLHPITCYQGEIPPAPEAYDAYIISGSRHAAYDSLDWITQLQEFIRACHAQRKKMVGICFGHQLIAHALGGETKKSARGWGVGIHRTRITQPQPWMQALQPEPQANPNPTANPTANPTPPQPVHYNLVVIHQDQVTTIPRGFTTLAENDFCPISMYVGDGVMLGIQGHPEFNREFCEYRIQTRKKILPPAVYRESLASLKSMTADSTQVLHWISRFLRTETPTQQRPTAQAAQAA